MRTRAAVAIGLAGFGLGAAVWVPAYLRLVEERDDARLALAAMGPAVVVQSPSDAVSARVAAVAEKYGRERPTETVFRFDVVAETNAAVTTETSVASLPTEGERAGRPRRERDPSQDTPEAREARRVEFVERMRARADTSRTNFIQRVALDDNQTARLDDVVFELNQSAQKVVNEWVSYIRETGTFDADYRIRFAHDLTAVMVTAYDSLDETLPETWRSSAGDFDLMRLVDPDVLRPMMEVQHEMGVHGGFIGGMMGGGRGFGGRGDGGPPRTDEGAARESAAPTTPTAP